MFQLELIMRNMLMEREYHYYSYTINALDHKLFRT